MLSGDFLDVVEAAGGARRPGTVADAITGTVLIPDLAGRESGMPLLTSSLSEVFVLSRSIELSIVSKISGRFDFP